MERRAFGEGVCLHRPPVVVYENDWHGPTKRVPHEPCWCGRPRLVLVVKYLRHWRAKDVAEEPDAEG
jgi:hypothetical protein